MQEEVSQERSKGESSLDRKIHQDESSTFPVCSEVRRFQDKAFVLKPEASRLEERSKSQVRGVYSPTSMPLFHTPPQNPAARWASSPPVAQASRNSSDGAGVSAPRPRGLQSSRELVSGSHSPYDPHSSQPDGRSGNKHTSSWGAPFRSYPSSFLTHVCPHALQNRVVLNRSARLLSGKPEA